LVTLEEVQDRLRPVRRWLWWVATLLIAIVLVGGLTRLTGSGLSITEWRPITGVLPPLSENEWLAEFERYRAIPQFLAVNTGMTLAELTMRLQRVLCLGLLARAVGFVFLLPFLFFLWRGLIDRVLGWKLAGIFALGGLQGVIGWWMVQSGLSVFTDVSQYRLAVHLTLACAILAAIVAVAESLQPWRRTPAMPRQRRMTGILLFLVFVQIALGALVAKTGAGLTFNTWPLMDGRFIPPVEALFAMQPPWKNFFENVLTIQFGPDRGLSVVFSIGPACDRRATGGARDGAARRGAVCAHHAAGDARGSYAALRCAALARTCTSGRRDRRAGGRHDPLSGNEPFKRNQRRQNNTARYRGLIFSVIVLDWPAK
jgi:cytochrome c oxidase assembly protein subunit 15